MRYLLTYIMQNREGKRTGTAKKEVVDTFFTPMINNIQKIYEERRTTKATIFKVVDCRAVKLRTKESFTKPKHVRCLKCWNHYDASQDEHCNICDAEGNVA